MQWLAMKIWYFSIIDRWDSIGKIQYNISQFMI